jgi:hypothetical protein
MIVAGGTPAFAAEGDSLAVVSTGLTEGQAVGPRLIFHPVLTGDDLASVELFLNGKAVHTWTPVPTGLIFGSAANVSTPGVVPATVRLTDESGATAEATTDVRVDGDAPRPTAFSPAADATVHGSSVTFTPVGLPDDVAQVDLLNLSDSRVLATATAAPWSFTTALANTAGPLHLLLRFTDRAANSSTTDLYYKVDNLGPRVRIGWPWQNVVGAVPGGPNIGLTDSTTDTAGVDRVEWWSGGVQIPSIGTYDFGHTSRTIAFEVRAWDKLGNESITPVSVRVDATGPSVTSVTPAAGALLRGTYFHSTVKATDPSGLGWINVNGYSMDQPNSVVPLGKDGAKVWTWEVYDSFGNRSTLKRTVIVDNTKPALKVTKAPKNKAKVTGTVKVNASASDHNGVNRVELLVNGKVVAKDTKAGYTFSINPKKYGKTFKVQLRAYDRAGNSRTSSTYTWHR